MAGLCGAAIFGDVTCSLYTCTKAAKSISEDPCGAIVDKSRHTEPHLTSDQHQAEHNARLAHQSTSSTKAEGRVGGLQTNNWKEK